MHRGIVGVRIVTQIESVKGIGDLIKIDVGK